MIRTQTSLCCHLCPAESPRVDGDSVNREYNALALARERGWRREWRGGELLDVCPDCVREREE